MKGRFLNDATYLLMVRTHTYSVPFLQPGPSFEPTCIAGVSAVARKPVFGVFDPVSKTNKSSCKDILLHARIQVSACVWGEGFGI